MPQTSDRSANEKRRRKLDSSVAPAPLRIVLPPPSAAEKRRVAQSSGRRAVMVGFHREVPSEFQGDVAPRLEWTRLPDGVLVSALSVTSPEALSMRVGIRAELAAGSEIRFFGGQPSRRFPVATRKDFRQEGDAMPLLWSPTVPGDTIGFGIRPALAEGRGCVRTGHRRGRPRLRAGGHARADAEAGLSHGSR